MSSGSVLLAASLLASASGPHALPLSSLGNASGGAHRPRTSRAKRKPRGSPVAAATTPTAAAAPRSSSEAPARGISLEGEGGVGVVEAGEDTEKEEKEDGDTPEAAERTVRGAASAVGRAGCARVSAT